MHVVVFTKSTPDTAAKVEVDANGNVTWGDSPLVVNPWDEYAAEEALQLKEKQGANTTVIAVGPEMDNDALKHCVAMGIQEAVRVWDDALEGSDSLGQAKALAAAIKKMGDVDMIITGKEAVDVNSDAVILQAARFLGWPVLSFVAKIVEIDPATGAIKVERLVEEGRETVSAKLPAVVTVVKEINEPRYPSFIGIRKAAKLKIPVWSRAESGRARSEVEAGAAKTKVLEKFPPPPREGEVEIIPSDDVEEAARILAEKLIEEKVV